jgi:putative endonuclease
VTAHPTDVGITILSLAAKSSSATWFEKVLLDGSRARRHASWSSFAVMSASRRAAGLLGERVAARHFERHGYRLIDRNYRAREGEIDLIATVDSTLVFCEVKTIVARGSGRGPAHPLEAVGPAKRRQVRRLARLWLAERRASTPAQACRDIRFDAIGILVSPRGEVLSLEHVESAF